MRIPAHASRGIVLIVVSGIVSLLVALAASLLLAVHASLASGGGALGDATSGIAAQSGMEYAAARLFGDSRIRFSGAPADRGDDWGCRDGPSVPLESLRNPSWAHGAPWESRTELPDGIDNDLDGETDEPGEKDRILSGDEALAGPQAPVTGRIRTGAGGASFLLRVEALEGKLPVNRALQGVYLLDDDGIPDRPVPGSSYSYGGVRILNNLGALLLDAAGGTRRWEVRTPGVPFSTSWLGHDLCLAAPARGYRSDTDVVEALSRSPSGMLYPIHFEGMPYSPAEIGRILPFLDTDPDSGTRFLPGTYAFSRFSFLAASRAALAAIWMYQLVPGPVPPRSPDFVGEPEALAAVCPFTGEPYATAAMILHPVEALRLADEAIAFRSASGRTWSAFRERLLGRADRIFREEFQTLSATPVFAWSWVSAKAMLAWRIATNDPLPDTSACGLAAWGTGLVDVDRDPANGFQLAPLAGFGEVRALLNPDRFLPDRPAVPQPAYGRAALLTPHGMSMAPPVRFSVACAGREGADPWGRARRLNGRVRTGEVLELLTQVQFDVADPAAPIDIARVAAQRGCPGGELHSPRVVSYPAGRVYAFLPPNIMASTSFLPNAMKEAGALGPGTAEGGLGDARLYWPFTEDFSPGDEPAPPPWSERWSLWSTAYAWHAAFPRPPYRIGTAGACHPTLADGDLATMQIPGWEHFVRRLPSGRTVANVDALTKLSIEGIFRPGSYLLLEPDQGNQSKLQIASRRGWKAAPDGAGPFHQGTFFSVEMRVLSRQAPSSSLQLVRSFSEWFVPDSLSPTGFPVWCYKVLFTLERVRTGAGTRRDPYQYRYEGRLYVNGSNAAQEGEMVHGHPALINGIGSAKLQASSVDEIRLYDRLAAPTVEDRFLRSATFASPVHRFLEPVRLSEAQWQAVIPPGHGEPISVDLEGTDGAGATRTARLDLGSGRVYDLPSEGLDRTFRSIRYKVRFSSFDAPGPLLETPLFESIWISYRTSSVWSGWREGR